VKQCKITQCTEISLERLFCPELANIVELDVHAIAHIFRLDENNR